MMAGYRWKITTHGSLFSAVLQNRQEPWRKRSRRRPFTTCLSLMGVSNNSNLPFTLSPVWLLADATQVSTVPLGSPPVSSSAWIKEFGDRANRPEATRGRKAAVECVGRSGIGRLEIG